jgi:hypothetical protein
VVVEEVFVWEIIGDRGGERVPKSNEEGEGIMNSVSRGSA